MSSLLSSYESEFKSLYEQTKLILEQASSLNTSKNERNLQLSTVEQNKDELLELIESMDVEVNNLGNTTERNSFKSKLREYKKQVQLEISQNLTKLIDSRDRDNLFGDQASSALNEEQRQQLLSNHAILSKTGERLQDANRIANETESVGAQIMMDLRSQRETLENSRNTLFQADSYVDKSITTLKTMSRRLIANKFISYAIIAVLILLILLVLFSKFH
ncbi:hypothetical protein KAFR_0J02350 [Kazachstania africana CBS 2517]|uniref:t-SNARE coiled-coil homology domain-containing protein n=1 Tax=Kazachstania africana (strain ATCC 22294 / BCRC 22015 / CBS 2517 / CECT 1963 / NBRC 1671 / NRRL Y-8276) TaxID=1071382 RepID=H2B0Z9_KAZAF|nr:hypothetical protein KAFR_0J02350 [Kazachstania africana CBS 2517]CCF60299.1 hypothetical protein KAFR_0J02350 [Kazachstania africana CBS 2517]